MSRCLKSCFSCNVRSPLLLTTNTLVPLFSNTVSNSKILLVLGRYFIRRLFTPNILAPWFSSLFLKTVLLSLSPNWLEFAPRFPCLSILASKLYLLHELTFCSPLSPHQAVQSLPDKKPLVDARMEMVECRISHDEATALNRQCNTKRCNISCLSRT